MAGTRKLSIGPVAMSNVYTTNILNPAAAGAGTGYTPTASYIVLRHIHIVNKTTSAATFRLYKGLTGANTAGTELWYDKSIPANDAFEWYGELRLDTADFLVGGASAATTLTFEAEGEVGLA